MKNIIIFAVCVLAAWFVDNTLVDRVCYVIMTLEAAWILYALFVKDKKSPLYWRSVIKEALEED